MSELVVAKAGGTSNSDAGSVSLSMSWIDQANIIIPSAPGRLAGETGLHAERVTDILLDARDRYMTTGEVPTHLTDVITERYANIVHGLGGISIHPAWLGNISVRVRDAVVHGEDAASMLGERLQAEIYQAQGLTVLDPGRAPHDLGSNPKLWRDWLSNVFRSDKKYVMPGNVTRMGGRLVTFSRGGSDTTSGFAAHGIRAGLNLNLTDGSAKTAHPQLVGPDRVRHIDHLTYFEGRELGLNGTGLVHPAAMVPLMIDGIPTEIRSTFDPQTPYTTLDNDLRRAETRAGDVSALSLMEDVVIHSVHEPGMAEAVGRLAAFESALADQGVAVIDSQGDGADRQSYFVNARDAGVSADALRQATNNGSVETSNHTSLITIVGYKLKRQVLAHISGVAVYAGLDSLAWQLQGHPLSTGRHSLRIGVQPEDARQLLRNIHRACIETPRISPEPSST